MALSYNINFYFDCKTRLCPIVLGRQEKIYFCTESFYLQGIIDDINEPDIFFLDCKHKCMMKSGAPSDKFIVRYTVWLPIEFYGFTSRIITLWLLVLSQFFRDGMGPFKYRLITPGRPITYVHLSSYFSHLNSNKPLFSWIL